MDISLYFHIPFCRKKCPYCHFYVIPNQTRYKDLLREGFALEWALQQELLNQVSYRIVSVYFGGGTPTLMDAKDISAILERIGPLSPECEITLEANPEDGSLPLFQELRAAGVNRMSFGVQSLDDRSLVTLGREHSGKEAREAIFSAHKAGIENISIDLMYDLPDQTESSWRYTLEQIQYLPIQHLSLYNLTIEPHTSFYKRKHELIQPKPEMSLRLLTAAIETFEDLHFERYEISAFAKSEFTSKHNIGYWTFRPFLGFGPSAFSYWNGERFQNIANLQRYTSALKKNHSPIHFRETLPHPKNIREQLAVGLRLKDGCLVPHNTPDDTRQILKKLEESGLIIYQGPRMGRTQEHIQLTEKGKLLYDSVATEII